MRPLDKLLATDALWRGRNLVELSSSSFDPDRQSIGSSPLVGDMGNVGVVVPAAPTSSQANRYLIRHCGFQVPSGKSAIIHAVRQLVTIRQVELVDTFLDGGGRLPEGNQLLLRPAELEVTSPGWSFTDGNVSFHLTWQGDRQTPFVDPTGTTAGTSKDLYGLDAALLFAGASPLPYAAPNGGVPPGAGFGDLYCWYDVRFKWGEAAFNQHILCEGPGVVTLWSSVHQTDPTTRPTLDVVDTGAMRPEDRFLATFRNARYGRVAGALVVETLPTGVPL